MQIIPIEGPASGWNGRLGEVHEALAGVIASIGSPSFGVTALEELNRWMPLSWWSVYRLFDDLPPTMHASGSYGFADGTHESWRVYRESLYRHDETFLAARESVHAGHPCVMHWHAREIPLVHRESIYDRHGLQERLSIVSANASNALLAVNFYRHAGQPAFADDEIDAMRAASPSLLACVERHLAVGGPATPALVLDQLTRRERDVCERMLKGWTHDGIAADLGISAATVKTYRDRAFDRLGIHHRNELFALVSGSLV